MKKNFFVMAALILLVVMSFGIANIVADKENEKINIVTSFYPVYIATLNITNGVDDVEVNNLTEQVSGCLHDYTLSTEEMVSLSEADMFVINGAGMEGFLDKVMASYPSLNVINSSEGLKLIETEECHEHHEHEEHTHEYNSHTFVSVENYIQQVKKISSEIIKIDAANRDKYELNTNKYITKLQNLKSEITNMISKLINKNIITYHNSFDYFAKEFGLNVVSNVENEHGKVISAKEIADVVSSINKYNIQAIFVEPDTNMDIANTIAKEANIKVYVLNPAVRGENSMDEYINIMEQNIKTLEEALG